MGRAPCCEKVGLNRGAWTREEDMKLIQYITTHGEGNWRTLPKAAGLLRCGKSCRLRWINYLRPDLKRGNITEEEDRLIIKLHSILGNRWSLIAGRLPGRTDNEIKNYWNTHLKKKLKSMGIDPNTHQPLSHIEGSTSCSANTNNTASEVESHFNINQRSSSTTNNTTPNNNNKNNLHTVQDYMDVASATAPPATPPAFPDISAAAAAAAAKLISNHNVSYNHYFGIPRNYFPPSSPSPPRDFKAKPIFFFDPNAMQRFRYAQSPPPDAAPIYAQHVAPIQESPIACSSTSSSSSSLPPSSSVSDQGEIVFPAIAAPNNSGTTGVAHEQTHSPIAASHVDVDPTSYNLSISISGGTHDHYHTPNNHHNNFSSTSHSMRHHHNHHDLEVDLIDDQHYHTPIGIGISSHLDDDHRSTPASIVSHLSHLSNNTNATTPTVSSSVLSLLDSDLMWDFDMGMQPMEEHVPTPTSHDLLHNLWGPPSSTASSSWQLHDHNDSKIA